MPMQGNGSGNILSFDSIEAKGEALILVCEASSLLDKGTLIRIEMAIPMFVGRDKPPPGGGERARLRLKKVDVSRSHARLFWEEGGWRLVDLKSSFGTFLRKGNSRPLKKKKLNVSDESSMEETMILDSLNFIEKEEEEEEEDIEVEEEEEERKLAPNVSYPLHHGDLITFADSKEERFRVHYHLPCEDCRLDGAHPMVLTGLPTEVEEGAPRIPPKTVKKQKKEKKETTEMRPYDRKRMERRLSRTHDHLLRDQLRVRLGMAPPPPQLPPPPATYIPNNHAPIQKPQLHKSPENPRVLALSIPLPSSNKGSEMLRKMGWQEGKSLGIGDEHITEPIPPGRGGRVGLGFIGRSPYVMKKR